MDSGGLVGLARLDSWGAKKRVLVSGLEPGLGDVLARTWFGETPSCCSLTLLLGPAWVLLNVLQTIFPSDYIFPSM